MGKKHQATFAIGADHPALPGHFPGTPVVPGVVVLDQVLRLSEEWLGRSLGARALKLVKFHSPLLPEQRAEVLLDLDGETLGFRVTRGELAVAQGVFVLGEASAP